MLRSFAIYLLRSRTSHRIHGFLLVVGILGYLCCGREALEAMAAGYFGSVLGGLFVILLQNGG